VCRLDETAVPVRLETNEHELQGGTNLIVEAAPPRRIVSGCSVNGTTLARGCSCADAGLELEGAKKKRRPSGIWFGMKPSMDTTKALTLTSEILANTLARKWREPSRAFGVAPATKASSSRDRAASSVVFCPDNCSDVGAVDVAEREKGGYVHGAK
jgi:hypothetical protein